MKYRVVKRARGWAVQQEMDECLRGPQNDGGPDIPRWFTRSTHRWHWLASLRLWWLRERNRK